MPFIRSEAPSPPNLRDSTSSQKQCGTCHMFDATQGVCWGYGNTQVQATQVCDSWALEPSETKSAGTPEVPMDTSTITDALGLQAAITPIVRAGEFYDEKRRELVTRARELGHPDLLPDNWNADGSLADRSYVWETAEARGTFNDTYKSLTAALDEHVEGYCWLSDFDNENIYYHSEGCTYSAPYTRQEDGTVTIGDSKRGRTVTSFVPAKRAAADDEPRSHRHVTNMIEYRKEKAKALTRANRNRPDERPCTADLELRAEDPTTGVRVLRSYASLFNTSYTIRSTSHRYEESVEPGAFKRSLAAKPEVVLRLNHTGAPLAATWNNTLRLGEDERGLWYEADLQVGADQEATSLAAKIDRGDLRESSFAFRCIDDDWNDDFTKRAVRVAELDRGDVSVVTFGASRATAGHMLLRSEEILEELRSVGFEGFLEALVDWRNYTLVPTEERTGKILSSESMKVLQQVLGLISSADDAVDEAQPLLADLMGVPNPDDDASRDATGPGQLAHIGRSEATEGDQNRSSPHLLDSALVDLGHLHRHVERLADPKVQKDLESLGFNQDHAMRHVLSAQDHIQRLGDHLEQYPSDPAVFRSERKTLGTMRSETDRAALATTKRSSPVQKPSVKRNVPVVLAGNDSDDLRDALVLRSI